VLVTETVREFSGALDVARADGSLVGLVPTMGALHAGHRSLIERAACENDVVAVTIFVNPLQFGDPDDIANYPRTLEADLAACRDAGADLVFAPSVAEMYPGGVSAPSTTVSVPRIGDAWEGASRPGHFDGVATVVAKLFAMAGRCRAYFGEKDWQQLALVRRMARDLALPVEVIGCPTVREPDGLALSSRNVRLDPAERAAATVLRRALDAGQALLDAGCRNPVTVREAMEAVFAREPGAALDYVALVDAEDLTVPAEIDSCRPLRLLVAAGVGPVRLIDNCEAVPAASVTPRVPVGVLAVAGPGEFAGGADGAGVPATVGLPNEQGPQGKDLVSCDAG
jgi:pantoate--beta-alanine ligase